MRRWIVILMLLRILAFAGEARLEQIALFGNTRTKSHVIFRELSVQTDRMVSDSLLQADMAWFIRSDFLRRIEFQLKPGSGPDLRNLVMVVREKGCWSAMPSWHSDDLFGWYGGGKIKLQNLFGYQQRLHVTAETGGKENYSVKWVNPWFGGGYFRIFSEAELYYRKFDYLYPDYRPDFLFKDQGWKIGIGRQIGRTLQIGGRVESEQVWCGDIRATASGDNEDHLSVWECFFRLDTRDWPDYPVTGVHLEAGIQDCRPSNGNAFQWVYFDHRVYRPVGANNIFAFRLNGRFSRHAIPVYERLHLGGGNSIRGHKTGDLVGENIILTNMELRIPMLYERNPTAGLHIGYAFVLFVDAGTAWFTNGLNSDRIKAAAGFGAHAIYGGMVIRGEYGIQGKGWGFINIGTDVMF